MKKGAARSAAQRLGRGGGYGVADGRTPFCVQTASQRILQKKNSAYAKNIHKRGEVPSSLVVDEEKRAKGMMALSPFAVGFLCFVVIGSSVVAFLSSLLGGAEAPAAEYEN